jgi:hypothetical protein
MKYFHRRYGNDILQLLLHTDNGGKTAWPFATYGDKFDVIQVIWELAERNKHQRR